MRLLISGYYGFGNIGDEAILAAILEQLATRTPATQIVILSGNPRRTRSQYGVPAVSRWSLPSVWRQLRAADLLISGGGGLIQDTTSIASPFYYLGLLRLARLARTPSMIFAQGVGPLRRRLVRRLTAAAFRHAAAITLRDEPSAALLRDELTLSDPPIHVTADPALLLSPCASGRTEQLLRNCGILVGEPLVGICLRTWPQSDFVPAILPLIRHLCESLRTQVLLIPFQPPGDVALARRLATDSDAQVAILDGVNDPREFLGVISSLDLLVSMRLHGLIFAAATAGPALGLCYDPKVEHFACTAEQPVIKLADLSAERLIREVEDLWTQRHQYAGQRRRAALQLAAGAELNFELLTELLEGLA